VTRPSRAGPSTARQGAEEPKRSWRSLRRHDVFGVPLRAGRGVGQDCSAATTTPPTASPSPKGHPDHAALPRTRQTPAAPPGVTTPTCSTAPTGPHTFGTPDHRGPDSRPPVRTGTLSSKATTEWNRRHPFGAAAPRRTRPRGEWPTGQTRRPGRDDRLQPLAGPVPVGAVSLDLVGGRRQRHEGAPVRRGTAPRPRWPQEGSGGRSRPAGDQRARAGAGPGKSSRSDRRSRPGSCGTPPAPADCPGRDPATLRRQGASASRRPGEGPRLHPQGWGFRLVAVVGDNCDGPAGVGRGWS